MKCSIVTKYTLEKEIWAHMHAHTQIVSIILLFCFVLSLLLASLFSGRNFLRFLWRTLQRLVNSSTVVHYLFQCAKNVFAAFAVSVCVCGPFLQNKCAVWVNCRVFASDKWLYFCTLLVQLGLLGFFLIRTLANHPTDRPTNFTWNI